MKLYYSSKGLLSFAVEARPQQWIGCHLAFQCLIGCKHFTLVHRKWYFILGLAPFLKYIKSLFDKMRISVLLLEVMLFKLFVCSGHIRDIISLFILRLLWTSRNDVKYQEICRASNDHLISLCHYFSSRQIISLSTVDLDIVPLFLFVSLILHPPLLLCFSSILH